MSIQYYGAIEIPAWLIDEELDTELQEEFGYKANGEQITKTNTDFSKNDKGILSYSVNGSTWGKFDGLEHLLIQKKIPYDTYVNHEDDAERCYFRPEFGEGKSYFTVILKGVDEVPFVPVHELRSLLTLPHGEEKQTLKELIEEYDPQVTPLEQYAKSDEEPCRLSEEMTEISKVEAAQLLRQSGYSKVEYIRADAGYHYLCADVDLAEAGIEKYNFRLERKDTLLPNRYHLCSQPQGTVNWHYSDSLVLELLPETPERLLFCIALLDGEDRDSYAIISTDFDNACSLAIEKHIRERSDNMGQHEQVPVVDIESSFEISCASDNEGNLYTIDLQPSLKKIA